MLLFELVAMDEWPPNMTGERVKREMYLVTCFRRRNDWWSAPGIVQWGGRWTDWSCSWVIWIVRDQSDLSVSADNSPNPQDPFGAYDDNNVVSADNEKLLFVPKPYRPGGDKKETKKTTKTPTTTFRTTRPPATTIRTIPFVQTTPATLATLPPAPV